MPNTRNYTDSDTNESDASRQFIEQDLTRMLRLKRGTANAKDLQSPLHVVSHMQTVPRILYTFNYLLVTKITTYLYFQILHNTEAPGAAPPKKLWRFREGT